jgi:hypothetical protein
MVRPCRPRLARQGQVHVRLSHLHRGCLQRGLHRRNPRRVPHRSTGVSSGSSVSSRWLAWASGCGSDAGARPEPLGTSRRAPGMPPMTIVGLRLGWATHLLTPGTGMGGAVDLDGASGAASWGASWADGWGIAWPTVTRPPATPLPTSPSHPCQRGVEGLTPHLARISQGTSPRTSEGAAILAKSGTAMTHKAEGVSKQGSAPRARGTVRAGCSQMCRSAQGLSTEVRRCSPGQ